MATSFSSTSGESLSPPPSSQEDDFGLYTSGQALLPKRHIPAPPCGRDYCDSDAPSSDVPDEVSKLEWCLTHPPRPGSTDPNDTRKITFKASIRTECECGAQVLLIDDGLVAKIYDPLYYCFFNRDWPSETIDVTTEADHDYTIEAAAYSALRDTKIQVSIMPIYHGSWTAEVLIEVEGQQRLREIRIILLEHIEGTPMRDINPFDLTREARENTMCKVIEAETDLQIAGLEHDDFEPHNIMVIPPSQITSSEAVESQDAPFEDPDLRVCIIDYALSCVYKTAGRELLKPGYHNPLFRWIVAGIYCEYGWLPPLREATD